jgi:hypothetical protein
VKEKMAYPSLKEKEKNKGNEISEVCPSRQASKRKNCLLKSSNSEAEER